MAISIIIPVLNEEKLLIPLLDRILHCQGVTEVILADGGSTDRTLDIARDYSLKTIECGESHRAKQMNLGASVATGEILYFLHADALPPERFCTDILSFITSGYDMGSFRLQLGSPGKSLKAINSFFTKINWLLFQGGGDKSLFIRKTVFREMNGYDESYSIMEDFEFVRRARSKKLKWITLDQPIMVSDRKYQYNNFFKVQLANLLAYTAFKYGISPRRIKHWYNILITSHH